MKLFHCSHWAHFIHTAIANVAEMLRYRVTTIFNRYLVAVTINTVFVDLWTNCAMCLLLGLRIDLNLRRPNNKLLTDVCEHESFSGDGNVLFMMHCEMTVEGKIQFPWSF